MVKRGDIRMTLVHMIVHPGRAGLFNATLISYHVTYTASLYND